MTYRSCDGLGIHPLRLLCASFRSFRRMPRWVQAEGREVIYTYQGRNAIALFCRLVGLQPGDEVLAPAYNCGAEIDPFVKAGARVVLYDVDSRLDIDIDRIVRSIGGSTRIVYVTRFFGFGRCLDVLAAACKKRGVFLVEDCAQALFSDPAESGMGRTGDAAIYSFVKTLPAPDGGALVVDRALSKRGHQLASPPLRATLRASLPLMKKWLLNSGMLSAAYRRCESRLRRNSGGETAGEADRRYPPMLRSNYFVEKQAEWAMSRVSQGVVQSADIAGIVGARRQNFQYLLDALPDVAGFSPAVTVLPGGACPMAFPFLATDRRFWYRQLQARGILIQGWPGYYPGFDWGACPQACRLKDKLLTLPVHQHLDLGHMQFIAESVQQVARLARAERPC